MQQNLTASNIAQFVLSQTGHALDIVVHETIDSTNSWCSSEIRQGRTVPFACFARQQTAGRGRRGNRWLMPARSNIALSLTWSFDIMDQKFSLLPLTVAVAIVEALKQFGIRDVLIKWPNDIYVNGGKIAGILIETQKAPGMRPGYAVIIGIGLNYDLGAEAYENHELTREEPARFADVISEAGRLGITPPGLAAMAEVLLSRVVHVCLNFGAQAETSLEVFRRHYDFCYGKPVQLRLDNEVLNGVARGISDTAELRVLVDNEIRCFNSADVSVRPQADAMGCRNSNS
jgi:BirA family transcriptional regulator, biotin operon repressor / biotin---[acetyl-CoA-carboxylase] ligase